MSLREKLKDAAQKARENGFDVRETSSPGHIYLRLIKPDVEYGFFFFYEEKDAQTLEDLIKVATGRAF